MKKQILQQNKQNRNSQENQLRKHQTEKPINHDQLIYQHIYNELKDPIHQYVRQTKIELKNSYTAKTYLKLKSLQIKLLTFANKKSSMDRIFSLNRFDKKLFFLKEATNSQAGMKKIYYNQKELQKAIKSYYFKDKISQQKPSQCLVEKLLKNYKFSTVQNIKNISNTNQYTKRLNTECSSRQYVRHKRFHTGQKHLY